MKRRMLLLTFLLSAATAAAQNVETDPLTCWWRTSAGAVRVGEPFTAILTCAVIETDDVKVAVDESRLEPSVAQFVPFEVLGGSHAADLRTGERRFFQYEYRMRLIAENQFGKDVALPETKLSYRIQSKVGQKAAVEGRDQSYILPPLAMRLLSLVPADATDIRDASAETFADVDRRAFRANLLTVIGGVLLAVAALVAVLIAVRLLLRARKPAAAADRLVGDATILRGVGRELSAVQRQREDGGWTADLAARALSALRIVATYALGRKAARAVVSRESQAAPRDGGQILVSAGWPKAKTIGVSGSATSRAVAQAIARSTNGRREGELESIEQALSRFTAAQYGQRNEAAGGKGATLNDSELDESLAAGQQVLKRLKLEQTWVMRRLGMQRKAATAGGGKVWSR